MKIIWIAILFAAAGCRTHSLGPVDIESSDICARCKMAISEKRYAIELIDSDGNAVKFDNLDCMIRFARERGVKNAGSVYLMDNSGKGWIRADEAYLVKSEQIHGPMGSGVVSFSDLSAAAELAARYSAEVRRFHEFWDR